MIRRIAAFWPAIVLSLIGMIGFAAPIALAAAMRMIVIARRLKS